MSKTNSLDQDHNNSGRSSAKNGMIMNESKSTTENYSWGNGSEVQDVLGDGGDLLGGFAWPPRSYTCTFCKREFRSAQALGGHMNVHRRDRARLRQMPSSRDLHLHPSNYSLFNLNLDPTPHYPSNLTSKPNPNPNFSPYTLSNMSSSAPTMSSPQFISSSPSSPQPNFPYVSQATTRLRPRGYQNLTMISHIPSYGVCKYDNFPNENEGMFAKKSEIVRLNLEIGLLSETKSDDLDLELRLGCS